ncbi:MAG: hypothetical protein HUU47_11290 [Bacteroidetes bacterium]|nr:hypothetical protein [Bacteroidota bacterium]
MKVIIKIIIFYVIIINPFLANSQSHLWAINIKSSYSYGLSQDSIGNIYCIGKIIDSVIIGSKVYKTNTKTGANYLIKFDSNGRYNWINIIQTSSKNDLVDIRGIKTINNSKIIVYGTFNSEFLKLSKNDSIEGGKNNITGFLAEFDSSGKCLKYCKAFKGGMNWGILTSNQNMSIDKNNNLFISFRAGNGTGEINYLGGIISLSDKGPRNIVIKYNYNLDSILWYKEFPSYSNLAIKKIQIGNDNNLYIACSVSGSFNFNKFNYKFMNGIRKSFISIISNHGYYIKDIIINEDSTQFDSVDEIQAIDTNNIYILGHVKDSILNKKTWYSPKNKLSKGEKYPYIGIISISNKSKWILLSNFKDNPTDNTGYIPKLKIDKTGNVYSSFIQRNNIVSIGGLTDSTNGDKVFAKFDSLGNALWLKSNIYITDFEYLKNNLVYTGYYVNEIKLLPFKLTSIYNASTFLAKTYDYKIERGNVKSGPYCAGDSIRVPYTKIGVFDPYCAGDSIRVPYTKIGVFDSSNYFVAEISDEDGNFNGNERELGRLKTFKDSTVIGRLPMFNVASSAKYRIRIRATKPAVQGFYRADTLRLLVYSRDKADPGADETICRGNTIKLSTYGGTKWTWSPAYKMNDSGLARYHYCLPHCYCR